MLVYQRQSVDSRPIYTTRATPLIPFEYTGTTLALSIGTTVQKGYRQKLHL